MEGSHWQFFLGVRTQEKAVKNGLFPDRLSQALLLKCNNYEMRAQFYNISFISKGLRCLANSITHLVFK